MNGEVRTLTLATTTPPGAVPLAPHDIRARTPPPPRPVHSPPHMGAGGERLHRRRSPVAHSRRYFVCVDRPRPRRCLCPTAPDSTRTADPTKSPPVQQRKKNKSAGGHDDDGNAECQPGDKCNATKPVRRFGVAETELSTPRTGHTRTVSDSPITHWPESVGGKWCAWPRPFCCAPRNGPAERTQRAFIRLIVGGKSCTDPAPFSRGRHFFRARDATVSRITHCSRSHLGG